MSVSFGCPADLKVFLFFNEELRSKYAGKNQENGLEVRKAGSVTAYLLI